MNPIKEYLYIGAIVVLLMGAAAVGVFVHRCHAAENALQSDIAQSKTNLANAEAKIKTLTADHAKEVHENEVATAKQLADNAAVHAADLVRVHERVRQLEAYRQGHPDVARPAPNGEASASGERGPGESASGFSGLGDVAASLADATRDLSVALDSCSKDRDSLNGKP